MARLGAASSNAELPVANGGTGAATATAAANALLPSQATHSGKFLTTDGIDTSWGTPAGSGDVVGPASSTDNAVARFDSTTGKLIQDSAVTVADTSGNMAGVGTINTLTLPSSNFVGLTDTQTLTNKTLTSPVVNTPTGIVKGDVGLGNVDNTSNATERAASATLTNKDLSSATNVFPAGSVLQVVTATNSTNTTEGAGTYTDTGLTASITPASTSNKVLMMVSQSTYASATNDTGIKLRLMRGAVAIVDPAVVHLGYQAGGNGMRSMFTYSYLDSPASASALTYKTQFARSTGAGTVTVNQDSAISSIILMEIKG